MGKPISAKLARRHLFAGKITKNKSGYTKADFVKNKAGRVVSKKASLRAKKSPWIAACQKARAALKIKGFSVIAKGTSSRCGDFYVCGASCLKLVGIVDERCNRSA